ncbi:ABC-type transport system involved in multi-copper enzyme maturation, permease component [Desulfuromusa kysingii]|uniref:ABC-type transport system involved in multi-copper enzyme maturation, permease component n=1 Tax=Desulfuromusa kysingii TaxID=37625 RepID=A0A1H4CWE7_9BACT|nr:ABC transporter permease subunit [Desulfuromusa kysingii]SEA64793.1 ABC-type transport system involved in multi-copper enzyme maturation, permease component [Desulfuromusa kysingii]
MRGVYAVALLSFKEGLRHRVLYGVLLAALLLMGCTVLVSGFFLRDISKVILDFCMATVTLGGLTIPFFLAIHLLAKDIERRTIFTLLTRPISRGQYLIGKFFGLFLITGLIMLLLTGGVWLCLWGGEFLFGSRFFVTVSWVSIVAALFLSWLSVLILNAFVVLWSTVTTSSFLATLLTLFSYVIGHSIDDVVRFLQVEVTMIKISDSIRMTVDVVKYLFPNLAAFDLKSAAAHGLSIPFTDVLILTTYATAYIVVLLVLSTLFFNRRDLA